MRLSHSCAIVCIDQFDSILILKVETKALPQAGQCIPAGSSGSLPRRVLITMSCVAFQSNSVPDCLRFAKSRPQFWEFCGATYRRIWEMCSPLQSTSGPVTDVENSVQIDA